MSRYIRIDDLEQYSLSQVINGVINIQKLKTADVVKVVHGEWVKDEEKSKKLIESIYICSACHNFEAWGETEKYNYCPHCGAKMDGDV